MDNEIVSASYTPNTYDYMQRSDAEIMVNESSCECTIHNHPQILETDRLLDRPPVSSCISQHSEPMCDNISAPHVSNTSTSDSVTAHDPLPSYDYAVRNCPPVSETVLLLNRLPDTAEQQRNGDASHPQRLTPSIGHTSTPPIKDTSVTIIMPADSPSNPHPASNQQTATLQPLITQADTSVNFVKLHPQQAKPPRVDHNACIAWFSCLCCFCPLGIIAVLKSKKSKDALLQHDLPRAYKTSGQAKLYARCSIIIGLFLIVFMIALIVITTDETGDPYQND